MRVIFFGTPEFAVPTLEALVASRHAVTGVVTRPDKPVGRGLAVHSSPVKIAALAHGIEVFEPMRLDAQFHERLATVSADAFVVVAYGRILPPALLALPAHGAINVHGSLLPRHRGASPVAAAILAGDTVTGVTTMQMEAGLDTGPVLLRAETTIGADETAGELSARLAIIGAALLVETLDRMETTGIAADPQDSTLATWAPLMRSLDGVIDWRLPALAIARRVRAYHPWPGTVTTLADGRKLKILRARAAASPRDGGDGGELRVGAVTQEPADGFPGEVLRGTPAGIEIATGEGTLLLLEAQPEGRRPQSALDLLNGKKLRPGDRLGA